MASVPSLRIAALNDAPVRSDGRYILYWMTGQRRLSWNFALDRALEWAKRLSRPLIVLEALRCDFKWASDRLCAFALQGMADNARQAESLPILYWPYMEPEPGGGRGLLAAFASEACVVVTDDSPFFFLPHMVKAAASKLPIRLEAVDSNGLLPMRAATRVYPTAFSFRAFLQKELPNHLETKPAAHPFARVDLPKPRLPSGIAKRWPRASGDFEALPIDHSVPPVSTKGGTTAARSRLKAFVKKGFPKYAERNQPDAEATSGLSPWLHWGHISAHEVLHQITKREGWTTDKIQKSRGGKREGWWNMSPAAEEFLDQLVTWRELGFNMASKHPEWTSYNSLPGWARKTLEKHSDDRREQIYSLKELEEARSGDDIWNAAQTQLVRDGTIHNYLRMLWGKRVLAWTRTPQEAYEILEHLNNKYALDGRDPNSYSGILWIFGRYDRPWGPERPIYGTVRYMSSDSTRRKLRLKRYFETYTSSATGRSLRRTPSK